MQPREVLLAVNAALCNRDAAAMVEHFAPDALVTDHRQGGMGSWRGRDELLAYYGGICGATVQLHEDLRIVHEQGDLVIANGLFRAQLTPDGTIDEFQLEYALTAVVRNDLIQELGVHQDLEAAHAFADAADTSSAPQSSSEGGGSTL